jgi:Fe-S oxidoreductase
MPDTAPGYAAHLFASYAGKPTVEVELHGARHTVPAGVTVLMALWYAGFDTVHGAGCLGGACGACTLSYRLPDGPATRTGLGCQVVVRDGMAVTLLPIDPPQKPRYQMARIDDPAEALFTIYPETRRCTNCDACTQVCPQDIPVRQTVRQMMNKDFAPVAPAFDECVMCGLCAMVCEVNIAPNLLGLYARKAVARAAPEPPELVRGMAAVREGRLAPAWEALLGGPEISVENGLETGASDALAARCRAAWERAAVR